jgi:hypothetical protein
MESQQAAKTVTTSAKESPPFLAIYPWAIGPMPCHAKWLDPTDAVAFSCNDDK